MADVLSIFYTDVPRSGFTLAGVIEMQAELTLEETHNRSARTTGHAVESGAVVSDHVIIDPERVTLTGFITDSPVIVGADAEGATQGAFDALELLFSSKQPVTIATGMMTYENMIITSMIMPNSMIGAMAFTIEATKVRIAEGRMVAVPDISIPSAADMASRRRDAGRQVPKPAEEREQLLVNKYLDTWNGGQGPSAGAS